MTWNKKHDEFARACNFSQSMEHLTRWQLRRAKANEPTEIETDLREFNREVGKQRIRGEYHRKTAITAINRLDSDSNGMFTIIKKYSPYVYKVLVRPLSFLERIQSAKCASTPKLPTVNPMFDEEHKKRANDLLLQNISKLDTLLRKLGMKCNQETLIRMWRYGGKNMSNVQDAVKYMLQTHLDKLERTQTIDNDGEGITSPIGWLHECLKYSRHLCDEAIPLSYNDTISALAGFAHNAITPIDYGNIRKHQT